MKFYTIAELKTHASKIMEETHKYHRDALITRHGKPMAMIVPITEEELEWGSSPKVKARLKHALRDKKSGSTVSLRKLASNA
jgi:prevent-host-death family protein